MKIKYVNLMIPVLMMFMIAGCTGIRVTADYDQKANFGKYKTFNFSKEVDKVKLNDLNRRRLKDDITAQMVARGYRLASTPDLLVNVFVKGTTKITANAYTNGFGGGFGYWRGGWGGYSDTYVDVNKYTEGTLFIDLIDVPEKKMIWEGVAEGLINPRENTREKNLNKVVTRIFDEFPR
jgi:hypothetical protein